MIFLISVHELLTAGQKRNFISVSVRFFKGASVQCPQGFRVLRFKTSCEGTGIFGLLNDKKESYEGKSAGLFGSLRSIVL